MKIGEIVNQNTGIERIYYGGVKPFWTKKEYDYQDLIINGFVIHRELPGQSQKTIPYARVDIYYDSPDGIGRKAINGVYFKVYKEACKFLSFGEIDELRRKWISAKYEGKYDFKDSLEKPIYDDDLPYWITGKKTEYKKLNKKQKASQKILDKKINEAIVKEFYLPKEPIKESPLQDLFLTKNIDEKDVAGEKGLSTLYKHIKGDRELSKGKAEEYAETLGVAPASLMFEPKTIKVWSSVKFSDKIDTIDGDLAYLPGQCYPHIVPEIVACPSDFYRLDIEVIKVKDKKSAYDGFHAYYYKTNKIAKDVNNKLCLVGIKNPNKTLLTGYNSYHLGIYQIQGTGNILLNVEPTAKDKVIRKDFEPDFIAPIVSFTKPEIINSDKILTTDISNIQKLGELIREEEEKRNKLKELTIDKLTRENIRLQKKAEVQHKIAEESLRNLFNKIQIQETKLKKAFSGNLYMQDDDIPDFLKDEKKRA